MKILCDVQVFTRAKVPNLWAGSTPDLDARKRIQGSPYVFEVRITGQIQLLQIALLKTDSFEQGQIRHCHVLKICAMETFDIFERSETGEIKRIANRIVRRCPITHTGQWKWEKCGVHFLLGASDQRQVLS